MPSQYSKFISSKSKAINGNGFDTLFMPDIFYPFQSSLVEWAVRKGRAAILADCGLGKTGMQLGWAQNVVQKTNRHVLVLTPLSVGRQTVREGEKFSVSCHRSQDGKFPESACVVVTNYEKLHYFNPNDFAGVVCDESSIFKNFDGETKTKATEFLRGMPYRLLCTATPSPNDFVELGTSAEALGELGYHDMITRFFVKTTIKDYLGWGRADYRLRGHAYDGFWKWVCSWARACRRPSDLGFDDGPFVLPELSVNEVEVKTRTTSPGRLFDVPAINLEEQRAEQKRTVPERCEKVAELVDHKEAAIIWCYRNDEADLCEKLIKGSQQVSGSQSDEEKEEIYDAFQSGQLLKLVIKPKIGAWGLNWQHCNHMTFFPSHSFEQVYQGIRRCWRFGQKKKVRVDMVLTEGSSRVMANYRRKSEQCDQMFDGLVRNMNQSLTIGHTAYGTKSVKTPKWLKA